MDKPTVFFSHSSRDAEVVGQIKDAFVSKTGGSVDVFLSSDGQSIPLGRNWVHRIQEALEAARIMVVFATPNAVHSDWIYFEAGFAYAKGIRVIPVGFLGVDLSTLRPPLALLQGFNVNSADGLNNLIAVVNEEFAHSHETLFTEKDYQAITARFDSLSQTFLAAATPYVARLSFFITEEDASNEKPPDALSAVEAMLREHDIDFSSSEHRVDLHGASVAFPPEKGSISIHVEPTAAHITLPIIADIMRVLRVGGLDGATLVIDFVKTVAMLEQSYAITGRLVGSGVEFGSTKMYAFRGFAFDIIRRRYEQWQRKQRERTVFVAIQITGDTIPVDVVRELVALLFDRGVLYVADDSA